MWCRRRTCTNSTDSKPSACDSSLTTMTLAALRRRVCVCVFVRACERGGEEREEEREREEECVWERVCVYVCVCVEVCVFVKVCAIVCVRAWSTFEAHPISFTYSVTTTLSSYDMYPPPHMILMTSVSHLLCHNHTFFPRSPQSGKRCASTRPSLTSSCPLWPQDPLQAGERSRMREWKHTERERERARARALYIVCV